MAALKSVANVISSTLAQIINLSISTGVYPQKLKMAKIIPIFKTDDNTDANNHRPISLSSNFKRFLRNCYLIEWNLSLRKIICFTLLSMAFAKHIQLSTQFWISLTPYRLTWISVYFLVVFLLTWKKLLILLITKVLLDKLYHYGFRGVINKWFSSYLEDRTEATQIGSFISPENNITFGVPQGSVLGALFFIIYINDIQECSEKLQFFLICWWHKYSICG